MCIIAENPSPPTVREIPHVVKYHVCCFVIGGHLRPPFIETAISYPLATSYQTPTNMPPSLKVLDLPNELLLIVANNLGPGDLCSFLLANRLLCDLLTPRLRTLAVENKEGQPALHWAIEKGYPILALLVLDIKGASSNLEFQCPDSCLHCGRIGGTALYRAVRDGYTAVVRKLVQTGASINAPNKRGQTALCWAAFDGMEEMVKLLLSYGADIRTAGHVTGKSALSWAAKQGHEKIVKLILEKDSSIIEMADLYGRTALLLAASSGHSATVKILLENGAEISCQDFGGMTPLHHAIHNGYLGVARLLEENGTEVNAQHRDFMMLTQE